MDLEHFTLWKWRKKGIPLSERVKKRNQAKVYGLRCVNEESFDGIRKNSTVLVTGDAWTLPEDVKKFDSFGISHDLYCVNRSMLFFERPVTHWAAVDAEESIWFSGNVNEKISPENHRINRHTLGVIPIAYDYFWEVCNNLEGEYARHLWMGNTGYFAILSSIAMGYERIVIAGMPLDNGRHFYDPEGTEGPQWIGRAYTQWMDFKIKVPDAEKVKSMSGYTAFILGEAKKEWLSGNGK